jgi:hypothetical protein
MINGHHPARYSSLDIVGLLFDLALPEGKGFPLCRSSVSPMEMKWDLHQPHCRSGIRKTKPNTRQAGMLTAPDTPMAIRGGNNPTATNDTLDCKLL